MNTLATRLLSALVFFASLACGGAAIAAPACPAVLTLPTGQNPSPVARPT